VIYGVRHRTTYSYDSEVAFARCVLRLTPCTNASQTLLQSSITVTPAPAVKTIKRDPFGNQMVSLIVDTPHEVLVVEGQSVVDVHAAPVPKGAPSDPWEAVRRAGLESRRLDADSPALFIYPTRAAPYAPQIGDYGLECFAAGRPILEAAAGLMERIKVGFAYDTEATDVHTPVTEAFAKRRGVCQDFAHVMICGLRAIGLPARYASGYIRTIPAPGQPRLEGADATHAWVELWCGTELGWVGLDPTNNLFVGDEHVVLAHGRDYHDAAPIDGVLLGSGLQTIDVEVDVVELASPAAAASADLPKVG
jgi:transglutaminase-like putative cysteine protease